MSHASVVMVSCPTTGRELSTGVEMDAATFERLRARPAAVVRGRRNGCRNIRTPARHSFADKVSLLPLGSQLVNARSLARQSSSVHPNFPLVVHQ